MVSNMLPVSHPMPIPRVPAARREAEQPKLTASGGGSQLMLPFAPRTPLHKQRAHYRTSPGTRCSNCALLQHVPKAGAGQCDLLGTAGDSSCQVKPCQIFLLLTAMCNSWAMLTCLLMGHCTTSVRPLCFICYC